MIVYKITNQVTGKSYIGCTTRSIRERWNEHKSMANRGSSNHIHNSIRKHGDHNFTINVLVECGSPEEMFQIERQMIIHHDTIKYGYNLTNGGEGTIGHNHSDETRSKMRNSHIGLFTGSKHPMSKLTKVIKPCGRMAMGRNRKTLCNQLGLKYQSVATAIHRDKPYKGYQFIV